MSTIFGGDAVAQAVEAALGALETGHALPERRVCDDKEAAGRRDRTGHILPGHPTNDEAGEALAPEVGSNSQDLWIGVSGDVLLAS